MSKANASYSLPPGDRDEPTPAVEFIPDGPAPADAGRKPALPGPVADKLDTISRCLDEAQLVVVDLNSALARGDVPLAEAAAWRLQEALMIDLRGPSRELRRAIGEALRERIRAEVSPPKQDAAA